MSIIDEGADRFYLERYAGLALNVAEILIDRESLPENTPVYTIIRNNLDAVYEVLGPGIDQIEDLIANGDWS